MHRERTPVSAEHENAGIAASGWSSAVELRQLRALLAVVEHGSISSAAAALGLAQSTVSEALAALERATGTPLLRRRRGAHAVSLTDAGAALLPHAQRMLQEVDAMHAAVARVSQNALGHVRISANESVSTYVLAPALGVLRKRWPKVRFSVTVGTCPMIRSAIADGLADLGLLLEESTKGDVAGVAQAIVVTADIALMVFAQRGHPLLHGSKTHARHELARYSIYVADSAGDFHDLVNRYFTADGLPAPRLESVGSIESVKRGVADDPLALGLLPTYAIAEELAQRAVSSVSLRPALPLMRLVALGSPANAEPHPIVGELVDQLRSR
ncbi:MAG: LysR family transcriptional regulator [Gemmatimonadaceae bacterium]